MNPISYPLSWALGTVRAGESNVGASKVGPIDQLRTTAKERISDN